MINNEIIIYKQKTCDLCEKNQAKYDGKTGMGHWAYMCESCFKLYGSGLGDGVGQKLIFKKPTTPKPKALYNS